MGGRGFESLATNQIYLQEVIDRKEINEIIEQSERIRQGDVALNSISQKSNLKKCACCESYVIPIDMLNYECPICGWIDNEHQNNTIDNLGGPNETTLRGAKMIWGNKR